MSYGITTSSQELLHDRLSGLRSRGVVPPTAGALVENGIATGSASRASRRRAGAHAFVGSAAWLLLGLLWFWQIHANHIPTHWLRIVSIVAGGAVVFAAFCVLWILWNLSIYRRRHDRHAPIVAHVQFERDALGRAIVVTGTAREASHLVVEIDDAAAAKYYVAADR